MEFYPPGEEWSYDPKVPAIELFDKSMSPHDMMGEVYSHYLPKVDKEFKAGREKFIRSITPKQIERMLMPDYVAGVKSGVYGDKAPTFSEWVKGSGGDAFFRGYVTGQYPADAYTEDQKALLEGLLKKLK